MILRRLHMTNLSNISNFWIGFGCFTTGLFEYLLDIYTRYSLIIQSRKMLFWVHKPDL